MSERKLKVAENIKRIISYALNTQKAMEHIIGDISITISEVRLSNDLRNANIFITPFNCTNNEEVIKNINKYSWIIKKILAKSAQLKYLPNIRFTYDNLYNNADNISNIINKIDNDD